MSSPEAVIDCQCWVRQIVSVGSSTAALTPTAAALNSRRKRERAASVIACRETRQSGYIDGSGLHRDYCRPVRWCR